VGRMASLVVAGNEVRDAQVERNAVVA